MGRERLAQRQDGFFELIHGEAPDVETWLTAAPLKMATTPALP